MPKQDPKRTTKNVHMSRRKSPRAGINASSIPPHPIPDLLAPSWLVTAANSNRNHHSHIICLYASNAAAHNVAQTSATSCSWRCATRTRVIRKHRQHANILIHDSAFGSNMSRRSPPEKRRGWEGIILTRLACLTARFYSSRGCVWGPAEHVDQSAICMVSIWRKRIGFIRA